MLAWLSLQVVWWLALRLLAIVVPLPDNREGLAARRSPSEKLELKDTSKDDFTD
jgi:hypothetical protein